MSESFQPATVEVHVRPRYQCSVCRKSWADRYRAERHIRDCPKDLDTRACPTCRYDEYSEGCTQGVRPEGVVCVRSCPSWKMAPTLARLLRQLEGEDEQDGVA